MVKISKNFFQIIQQLTHMQFIKSSMIISSWIVNEILFISESFKH